MPLPARLRLPVLALLAVLALPAGAAASEPPLADQIVLMRREGLTAAERADLRADADVTALRPVGVERVELVAAEPGGRVEALDQLEADPDVVWAEPNVAVRADAVTPADALWDDLWGLRNVGWGTPDADIDADEAWEVTRGATAVVGVVDTGVDATHPDLLGRTLPGRNFHPDGVAVDDPRDGEGHGTHVAGTIAAASNELGVVGVAPEARVMPLRVLGDTGSGTSAGVAAGFAYAGDQGLRVVNASLGSTTATQVQREAIASHPGTLYFGAAGNRGRDVDAPGGGHWPCAYDLPNVLCVGATTAADGPASFSNRGAVSVDLFAPGQSILSTSLQGGYAWLSGTSMATPHVAGAAALLAAAHPAWSTEQLKRALLESAEPRPGLAGLAVTGARLNAALALAQDPVLAPAGVAAPELAPAASAPAASPPVAPATPPAAPRATPAPLTLRLAVRGRAGVTLRVRLAAPARAAVTLERRARGRWVAAGARTVRLAAGEQRVRVRGARGRPLPAGAYRATVTAAGARRVLAFRLR